ncbi:MAG: hypothetical protein OIN84_09000 [Candidatus Methanoperedens sp.]|nr:hypothetical protein [Candidatus Methanoperedens sp.]
MDYNFSKRTWIFLWICLILINVILRFPVTPHEIGNDSFLIHFISDSISVSGHAKWWIHPLSIVGLYPFSQASALPFFLSGVSQLISLAMEQAMWVSLVSLGIFSLFTSYLMAGVINNDKIFKFITALIYSTSPGILYLTTWSASGRGFFLVMLPLFIYFLIKYRFSKLKYVFFTIILFILLFATHNLFLLVIPIVLSFFFAILIRNIQFKSSVFFGSIVLLALFLFLFMELSIQETTLDKLILNYSRYVGIMGFFTIGGFISILFKKNRTFEESFIILVLLFFTPLFGIVMYAKYFMLPLEALLASYGVVNLIRISQNRKTAYYIMLIFIIISMGVSEYYQFGRSNIEGQSKSNAYWAEESTINAAQWTKSFTNKLVYTDDGVLNRRVLAYSGVNMFSEGPVVYPIQGTLGDFNVSMRSPFSSLFYLDGPYNLENQTGMTTWIWYKLYSEGLDGRWGNLAQNFNVNYYIKNERAISVFLGSRIEEVDKVFDNGNISIWNLRNLF